ncbi:hypothetical protein GCM10011487_28610 [Steroidobacter agaridevorans]|uniref:5'-deoxynucleotidase n=1 Tax=Steroidobacter agaridevorans TaxID=2695856 RepID=A0A829YDG9_9GAMM|nr:HD domain-containing protein [Steroidobacter agaridevorans]GFE80861.1 hypothetical protein GCM10011487_28610 [Steroidobacter agaridevorans]
MTTAAGAVKQYDVALIVALQEESKILKSVFRAGVKDGLFSFADKSNSVRQGMIYCIGDQGPVAAALATDRLLQNVTAKLIINMGISGMLRSECQVPSVVVARSCDEYDYRSRAVPRAGDQVGYDFQWGGETQVTSPWIMAELQSYLSSSSRIQGLRKYWSASLKELLRSELLATLCADGLCTATPDIHADVPIAAGQSLVASKAYRDALLKRNRLFAAVDMESAAILKAALGRKDPPEVMVIRGLSDGADETKSKVEGQTQGGLRRLAMTNAAQFAQEVLNSVLDFNMLGKSPMNGDVPPATPPPARNGNSGILELMIEKSPEAIIDSLSAAVKSLDPGASLYERLVKALTAKRRWLLEVRGTSGTGKTTLLRALVSHAAKMHGKDPAAHPLPIYVDAGLLAHASGDLDVKAVLPEVHSALAMATGEVLLVVDGIVDGGTQKNAITKLLAQVDRSAKARLIIGRQIPTDHAENKTGIYFEANRANEVLHLQRVLASSEQGIRLITDYATVMFDSRASEIAAELTELVRAARLPLVDMLTVTVLSLGLGDGTERGSETLHSSVEQFVLKALDDSHDELKTAAKAVFERYIHGRSSMSAGDEAPGLYAGHSLIRDFLVAFQVSTALRDAADGNPPADPDVLKRVYPFGINRFCKTTLSSLSAHQKQQVIDRLKTSYDSSDDSRHRAHLCYLIGRTKDPVGRVTQSAIAALQERREAANRALDKEHSNGKAKKDPEKLKQQLRRGKLLIRTIYISLIQLGDSDASRGYIHQLMRDPEADRINRGFHLEYYGDIEYDPKLDMSHEDTLCDFSQTFETLQQKIAESLDRKRQYDLREVDIYTLLSLAQHRHAARRLSSQIRPKLLDLLTRILENKMIKDRKLLAYCQMVQMHLGDDRFSPATIYREMFNLKTTVRSGWIKRGRHVPDPESVAEHTWSAMTMAQMFLPRRIDHPTRDQEGYAKERVMNMLLIHDLAEARTGDYLPGEESDKIAQEEAYFLYLNAAQTYDEFDRSTDYLELWTEFCRGTSYSARVAREIDKLENYVQLLVYRGGKHQIPDFDTWKSSLEDEIKTPHAQRIVRMMARLTTND